MIVQKSAQKIIAAKAIKFVEEKIIKLTKDVNKNVHENNPLSIHGETFFSVKKPSSYSLTK